jgi:hypothetical protein
MSSYLKRIKQLESQRNLHTAKHITLTENGGLIVHQADCDKVYAPCPTGTKFHESKKRVKAVMGAFGSGKTTMNVCDVVRNACLMPRCKDGIRKAKFGFIRNTYGELESTTLPSWLHWFGELGHVNSRKKPYIFYKHTFNDGDGVIELEVVFVSLDRVKSLKKFRSFEFTGIYINEATEIPSEAITQLSGRINRYPSHNECAPYYSYISMDYNPPKPGHHLYNRFEKKPNLKYEVLFKQPPGLLIDDNGVPLRDESGEYIQNKNADNAEFLGEDYYVLMANAATDFEEIKVFCLGQYGLVRDGKPVYEFQYNDDLHSIEHREPNPELEIHFGWDYGTYYTACILFQISPTGQAYVFKEFVGCDGGLRGMIENRLLPFLTQHYPNYKLGMSTGDPSGNSGLHGDARSCIDILKEYEIETEPAATNSPIKRVETVRYFLTRMIERQPALQVSRTGCPILREGFISGYHFKKLRASSVGDKQFADEPNKNEFSHPHDALQYGLMRFLPHQETSKPKLEQMKKQFQPVRRTMFG